MFNKFVRLFVVLNVNIQIEYRLKSCRYPEVIKISSQLLPHLLTGYFPLDFLTFTERSCAVKSRAEQQFLISAHKTSVRIFNAEHFR